MLRVGIVGIGFMGWIHWLAYKKVSGVEVVAICESDAKKLAGDWTDIQGNFGPPGEQVNLSEIATYDSIDTFLADANVDLIDICLPPALHPPITIKSLQSGRPVFCEKPMALRLEDCDAMLHAASAANQQLLIGHVLPFFPEYRFARSVIDDSKYGELLGGHFKRVISDPTWISNFYDPNAVGGPLLDLHVHDAHWIRLLFGMPDRVHSRGRMRGDVPEYCATVFEFGDQPFVISSVMGVINQQGRPFTHGFEIHLERATIQFEFAGFSDQGESMPLKLLTEEGDLVRPDLGDGDPVNAFIAEIEEVRDSVTSGSQSAILGGQLARDAIEICQMQAEALSHTHA